MLTRTFGILSSGALLLLAAGSPLSAAPEPTGPSQKVPLELSKLWLASIQAETALDYPGALDQLNAFAKSGGDPFMASLRTGWLHYMKADYAKSEAAYQKALQLQPGSVNALLGVVNVSRAQMNPAKTERAASALLRIDPTHYTALMTIAGIHYAAADYRKAAAAYRRTLAHYPDDYDALSGSAWSSLNSGDKPAALADFIKLLSISPEYPQAQAGFQKAGAR